MTGKTNRRRGADGEREWCALLRENGFPEAARNLSQSREGGGDVILPPWLWEVKRRKEISVLRFMDQAEKAVLNAYFSGQGLLVERGAVAMREDGARRWYVMLRAEDFFQLIRRSK